MLNKINRETILNIVRHGIYLLALYLVQGVILPWFGRGAIPMLLAVAASGVSLLEGSGRGAIFGLFAGILCDVALGRPTMLFTITLTAIGFFSGLLGDTIFSRRFPSYMVCCFFTMIIASFVQMFPLMFFSGVPFLPLLQTTIYQTVTSLLFAIPMYPASKQLAVRARTA